MNGKQILVALGVLAGFSLLAKKGSSEASPTATAAATGTPLSSAAASSIAATTGGASTTFQGQPAVVNSAGVIRANAVYKGHPATTQAAQINNIAVTEGVNTPIQLTPNPLEVKYQVASGEVFTSSRSPVSDAEHTTARVENIKSMISSGAYSPEKAAELRKKYNI